MIAAYYNENDPYAAEWLRNLIKAGHIAPGFVDERDIRDVRSEDLEGFAQCHFFAGIGVWSYALRLAGWPDDRPIWTGSCPCQPFSGAGKRGGFADERHLWPVWFNLIRERRPCVILGEQVASPDGYAWFDHVQTDMEGLDYPCGAVVTPAAGYGAPEERHRIYWMAHTNSVQPEQLARERARSGEEKGRGSLHQPARRSDACGLVHTLGPRLEGHAGNENRSSGRTIENRSVAPASPVIGLADTNVNGCDQARKGIAATGHDGVVRDRCVTSRKPATGPVKGFWRAADWLFCRDGKWRPVEPGTFPLANGIAARVGQLRAYGNAIVATQAAEFIEAVSEELGYV